MEEFATAEVKIENLWAWKYQVIWTFEIAWIWQQNKALALVAGIEARQAVSAGLYRIRNGVARIDNKPRRSEASNLW